METMGRYELKGELGRGGMAVVYRAVDPHIGREVAVKVLPREFLQDGDFLARFQREVRTIGQLNHAAIVPLHDAGEDKGQPYLVMRLMHGGSLLDRLKRGAIPVAETATMFSRLAGALDEAHGKGIIHRDLKPGNILLDEQGQPYLSDFGIAKLTEATSMNSRGVIGTPAYMSPEHFEGKVSAQSDVYAMGIILFQMLTGRLPFQAATPPEYMKAHFMDTPPPLRSINPNLPVELEAVLQKALAKSKEQRFKTVGELAQAVNQAVSGSASQPVSGSASQRSASQPFADRPTVMNTPPPMSRPVSQPISQSVGQPSASQPVITRPTRKVLWGRLIVGGLLGVMLLWGMLGLGLAGLWLLDPGSSLFAYENSDIGLAFDKPASMNQKVTNDQGMQLQLVEVNRNANSNTIPAQDGVEIIIVTVELTNLSGNDIGYDDEKQFKLVSLSPKNDLIYEFPPVPGAIDDSLGFGSLAAEDGIAGRLVFRVVANTPNLVLEWASGEKESTPRYIEIH